MAKTKKWFRWFLTKVGNTGRESQFTVIAVTPMSIANSIALLIIATLLLHFTCWLLFCFTYIVTHCHFYELWLLIPTQFCSFKINHLHIDLVLGGRRWLPWSILWQFSYSSTLVLALGKMKFLEKILGSLYQLLRDSFLHSRLVLTPIVP